jgi:hypothetical protein
MTMKKQLLEFIQFKKLRCLLFKSIKAFETLIMSLEMV